jgi:hypothetical protein
MVDVKTVYLIPPATRIAISQSGADFQVTTLRKQMQFEAAPELDDQQATFTAGQRRIRVDRGDVVLARYDGTGGRNQFGA